MKNLLLLIVVSFFLFAQLLYAQWNDLVFPAASGGAVHSLAVKGTKLFAGKNKGIYVSEDNGQHWKKINPDLPPRYSTSPDLQAVVTTDNFIVVSCSDKDVHISLNDGKSWINQNLEVSPRTTPTRIAADGNWIIAGDFWGNTFNGQSTDGGQSWSAFDSIPQPVYCSGIRDSVAIVGSSAGLYRSTNYGSSWELVKNIPLDSEIPAPIAFSGTNVYTGLSAWDTDPYILISPDNGLTWPEKTTLPCDYINDIVCTPAVTDSFFIFAATDSGIFRSPDEGQNWIKKNSGLSSDLILSLAIKTEGTGLQPLLFAGTGNGIFSSSDWGNSWSEIGSPAEWSITSSGSDIYAYTSQASYVGESQIRIEISDSGYNTTFLHSSDNGDNWQQVYAGYLEGMARITSLVINSNDVMFAAGGWYGFDSYIFWLKGGIVFTSSNGGLDWKKVYADTLHYSIAQALGTHGSNAYLNIPKIRLCRFFNDGESWENLNPVFSPITSGDSIVNPPLNTFAADGNKIYVGGTYASSMGGRPPTLGLINLIGFSEDNGQSWSRIESPLDSITIINNELGDTLSVITELYPDGDHIMVSMFARNFYDDPRYSSYGGGFFHLNHVDSEWIIADTAFTNTSVFAFAADGSNIFAGTEKGIFSTKDYGRSWKEVNTGMGSICVKDLFVSDSYLFASTTNGIWTRALSEITSIEHGGTDEKNPQLFTLDQNYPNPFNPSTTIKYRLMTRSHIKLAIYDITGRVVKTLLDQTQNKGEYNITFKADGIASGVYIYRLKAGSFEQNRKMVLLR